MVTLGAPDSGTCQVNATPLEAGPGGGGGEQNKRVFFSLYFFLVGYFGFLPASLPETLDLIATGQSPSPSMDTVVTVPFCPCQYCLHAQLGWQT